MEADHIQAMHEGIMLPRDVTLFNETGDADYAYEVEGLADCVGVLNRGRLVAQVRRSDLQELLHRYLLEIPEGWSGPPAIDGRILSQEGGDRQAAWIVWGEHEKVIATLKASGATVRDTEPLTLDRAARVLLSMEEPC